MLLFLLVIQLFLAEINSELYTNSTTDKIKYILNKYRSLKTKRCVSTGSDEYLKVNNFAENTLRFLKKTERFGEFLKYINVSDCNVGASDIAYKTQHIFNGLLIHEEVPATHWEEYKVGYFLTALIEITQN